MFDQSVIQLVFTFLEERRPGLVTNRGRRGGAMVRIVDPTPEEIRQRAAIIRAGWTDEERRLRMGFAEAVARQAR
jgi:hypothetical protein